MVTLISSAQALSPIAWRTAAVSPAPMANPMNPQVTPRSSGTSAVAGCGGRASIAPAVAVIWPPPRPPTSSLDDERARHRRRVHVATVEVRARRRRVEQQVLLDDARRRLRAGHLLLTARRRVLACVQGGGVRGC